jgi:clan AA aspartic protease (TIGR02281 family)
MARVPSVTKSNQTTKPQPAFPNQGKSDIPHMQLVTGITTIYDIAGNLINKIPTVIIGNGWLAIPAQKVVGGYFWQFTRRNGDVFDIAGGIIGDRDELGIWQLRNEDILSGPQLSSWAPGKPIRWTSIVSPHSENSVHVTIVSDQRYVIKVTVPSLPNEPGIFTQGNLVVGWKIGGAKDTAFLWNGLNGNDLVYEVSVHDYYRATFENGREEQFILALAQSGEAPSMQLAALADAFLLIPKLDAKNTPRQLRREQIIPRMQSLISALTQNGQYVDIADAFDGRKLVAVGDTALVMAAVGATLNSYGFEPAVDLIESVLSENGAQTGLQWQELQTAHKRLYRRWLSSLVQSGDIQMAQQIHSRAEATYSQDPHIRLIGAELALVSGDWSTAQQLLALQVYPAELADKVALLKKQIDAEKSEEGKIVIRFTPGSRQIPVTAYLGNGIEQSFLIDTGATIVTIPRSTAEKLGVSDEYAPSRRRVQTAGGYVDAYEVNLPSVQLGDSQVENVSALVLDLPNQPNVGLLGMNYLSLFRMNINSDRGILTLAPR